MSVSLLALAIGGASGFLVGIMVADWCFYLRVAEWTKGRRFRLMGKYWQMRRVMHVVSESDPS